MLTSSQATSVYKYMSDLHQIASRPSAVLDAILWHDGGWRFRDSARLHGIVSIGLVGGTDQWTRVPRVWLTLVGGPVMPCGDVHQSFTDAHALERLQSVDCES